MSVRQDREDLVRSGPEVRLQLRPGAVRALNDHLGGDGAALAGERGDDADERGLILERASEVGRVGRLLCYYLRPHPREVHHARTLVKYGGPDRKEFEPRRNTPSKSYCCRRL